MWKVHLLTVTKKYIFFSITNSPNIPCKWKHNLIQIRDLLWIQQPSLVWSALVAAECLCCWLNFCVTLHKTIQEEVQSKQFGELLQTSVISGFQNTLLVSFLLRHIILVTHCVTFFFFTQRHHQNISLFSLKVHTAPVTTDTFLHKHIQQSHKHRPRQINDLTCLPQILRNKHSYSHYHLPLKPQRILFLFDTFISCLYYFSCWNPAVWIICLCISNGSLDVNYVALKKDSFLEWLMLLWPWLGMAQFL